MCCLGRIMNYVADLTRFRGEVKLSRNGKKHYAVLLYSQISASTTVPGRWSSVTDQLKWSISGFFTTATRNRCFVTLRPSSTFQRRRRLLILLALLASALFSLVRPETACIIGCFAHGTHARCCDRSWNLIAGCSSEVF
jgi:hypothetical protein